MMSKTRPLSASSRVRPTRVRMRLRIASKIPLKCEQRRRKNADRYKGRNAAAWNDTVIDLQHKKVPVR